MIIIGKLKYLLNKNPPMGSTVNKPRTEIIFLPNDNLVIPQSTFI